eukprot:CAMPEP_0169443752 /NCGR_PEP_ID=MMETSP1042-20121227/9536_1 /TAXON_ID=464988 /ORGANISM="Hemiselmis andersenii, Strain CCMP1180" /LENGTH=825 /DNA_ID=CAMNT_0009555027 /DNA_START=496 /DNA_END=2973 /DNA_ORIENTATION=-
MRGQADFAAAFGMDFMTELFDRNAALYLADHLEKYILDAGKRENALEKINALLEKSQGGSSIRVAYVKAAKADEKGRWFANNPGAMQGMNRRVRQTICDGLWIDLDFVNCHPVLLSQICKNLLRIDCPFLDKYINNRDEMLQEMVSAGVQSRSEAKMLILKVLNGGSVSDIDTPWWEDLCKEFATIACQVASHTDHKTFLDNCQQEKGPYNLHARTMSAVLCSVENNCLEQLYSVLKDHNCIPGGQCSLIFDGLMIPGSPDIRERVLSDGFLNDASKRIHQVTGYNVTITIKEFDEPFELPDGYAKTLTDIFVIDHGEDLQASDEFVRRYKHRLIKCKGRIFWQDGTGIFTDDPKRVKDGVLAAVSRMEIYAKANEKLLPYSQNVRRAEDCTRLILADPSLEQPDFLDKLFSGSIHYLAFEDGIYSFETGELLPYPVPGVYFMHKINRPFPTNVDPDMTQQVMDKVLVPAFPDKEHLQYFLHRLARALAGDIQDKRWHICIGERNCSKGVLCDLLLRCFGDFVQTINSENFLIKSNTLSCDAAKSQSWTSSLEFKRLAISNEIQLQGGRARVDGNLIKRMASGGDQLEVRTNYVDETRKRLQCTMFMYCNDFPRVEPPDAYQSLDVFDFYSSFHPQDEIDARGDSCPKHWKPADPNIKTVWATDPLVLDAFTITLLEAWNVNHFPAPDSVSQHTKQFMEAASESEIDRFAQVVKYDPSTVNTTVFTEEIKIALERAGFGGVSSYKVGSFVNKLYGDKATPPQHGQHRIQGKRAYGFTHLRLANVLAFDGAEERRIVNIARNETIRQQVRNGDGELGKRSFDEMEN